MTGEPEFQWKKFLVYLDLGPGRSLRLFEAKYRQIQAGTQDGEFVEAKPRRHTSGWVKTLASRWNWRARADAYDRHQVQLREEHEIGLLKRAVAESLRNRRKSRSRSWMFATAFYKELMDKLGNGCLVRDADGNAVKDEHGQPVLEGWTPKDLRDLGLASAKMGAVEERAFRSLPDSDLDKLAQLGAEMAAAWDEFRAGKALADEGVNPEDE
jgi:hypothetical protein